MSEKQTDLADSARLYGIDVTTIEGRTIGMDTYQGHVLLIVNVASRCGFTPQYAGLEALYRRHQERRFVVLGFPCNQFGAQEPGSAAQISRFCTEQYDVTFPLFSKVDVNGPSAHPLFEHLKSRKPGFLGRKSILWNFTKFLVGRDGDVRRRYSSRATPETIERDLLPLL
jgi:glutathione peroxidase